MTPHLGSTYRAVEIEFFGRLLLELGARGPFRVGEIRGYRFSADEFMDPHEARMLYLLMEDVARRIAIDAPAASDAPNAPSTLASASRGRT